MPQPMSQMPPRLEEEESGDDRAIPGDGAEIDIPIEEQKGYKEVENEDGSVDIFDEEEDEAQGSEEFKENIAEYYDKNKLKALGTRFKELIDRDVEDRTKRDDQYAEGIRRTGLGNDSPGGAGFSGASKVVHPMLAKGCVDFASRAVKELYPPVGPCKTQIIGEQTEEKLDKAERKKTYMNWQSTTQIEENRAEIERLLSQVPLAGAGYKRWWWDEDLRRPRTEAVFIDDVFIPYGSADFYTASRVSYRQMIDEFEYEKRVRVGIYRDAPEADNPGISAGDSPSRSQEASDKIEGADSSNSMVYNENGLRRVWLIEALLEIEDDPYAERPAPYIIHLDNSSETVLGIFRNWEENDDRYRKKHWMSEWSFIPWRDGPAVGLAHLIGSLAASATGALRAILDSAHIQNFPGAVRLAGSRGSGENVQVEPTKIVEISAAAGADDIRKVIMPFPFNGPSATLFQVMEWLTQQAEQVVATASEKIADAGANMPVGTALALIEHGSTNFSAIHSRLHAALKRDLEILHRLNSENMDDEETIEELGELVVRREDFMGPMDVIPVSDPNIFSEAQRYAQLQAVLQLKADPQFATFFKAEALLGRALKLLNVPDVEGIANLPKESKRLTPVEENYALAMSERPLKVYADQDDISHLKVHIQFATSPMFGANPLVASGIMAPMLQHCKEHMLNLWKKHSLAATEQYRILARHRGIEMGVDEAQIYGCALADQLLAGVLTDMVMPGLEAMQKIIGEISQAAGPKPSPDIMLMENNKLTLGKEDIASKERLEVMKIKFGREKVQADKDYEAATRDSQEKLAQLATSVEMIRDQAKQGADQQRMEFEALNERNMLVLTKVLESTLQAALAPGEEGGGLGESLVAPVVGALEKSLQDALTGLGDANAPLHQKIEGLAEQQEVFRQIMARQAQDNAQAFANIARGLQQSSAPPAPQGQQLSLPGV